MRNNPLQSAFKKALFLLSLAALSCTTIKAQTIVGPFDIYVSKQVPANLNIFSGSVPAYADEGRVIKVKIYNIQGPITVNPVDYNLNGPPCPTYTNTGQRIPPNPVPGNTTTFSGTI